MKARRIAALGLVVAAGLWVASGHLLPHETNESRAAIRPSEAATQKLFRVGVIKTAAESHSRKLVLSGRTEADRRVAATARASGIVTELKVKRGTLVKQGDVIAVLSDEAREAQVMQARALLDQRKIDFEAKSNLAARGNFPRLQVNEAEALYRAAEAALATAVAERDRGIIRAPWSGVVNDVSVEVGQAVFSMAGKEIAQIVGLDPMLAVTEVSERKLHGLNVGDPAKVRLVTGQEATGKIRFVAKTASATTRTYRVDIELPNADNAIPDGITVEVVLPLTPVPSARVPRSALTFSSAGDLGVRTVNENGTVGFVPVAIVEDEQATMWVSGLDNGARVIVQGQDFVREGQKVEPVEAADKTASQ
jgi:multidrug efflux system membrane fusion protein